MNKVRRTSFLDRLNNAVKAFKGRPISTLYLGMDVKRCDKCSYKSERPIRDDLLVTAGARAAYMEDAGHIELPHGIAGEAKLAAFVSRMVDRYLNISEYRDIPCDLYIEERLMEEYGSKEETNEDLG